jgi:quercetin dioxygenase-like cupin family protein
MRSIAHRMVPVVVAIALISTGHAYSQTTTPQHAAAKVTRLYTGEDGQSHIEEVEMKFPPAAGASTAAESEHITASETYVVRLAPDFFQSWHNADKRRYVVTMSGQAEVEVANGQKFTVMPGQIVLAEDLTGKGHTFRVVGDSDWVALFVDFAQ